MLFVLVATRSGGYGGAENTSKEISRLCLTEAARNMIPKESGSGSNRCRIQQRWRIPKKSFSRLTAFMFSVTIAILVLVQLSSSFLVPKRQAQELLNPEWIPRLPTTYHIHDKELLFQSALNTLSCFITPSCFPRYKCREKSPQKIKRRKKWEEMSFCVDDLISRQEQLKVSAYTNKKKQEKCLVYSFGIDSSTEWEQKMAQHIGCAVHAFDPTVNHNNTSFVTFHKLGLQGDGPTKTTNAVEYGAIDSSLLLPLRDIMKRLGHEERTIDVLMLDCEGCEWGVLHQLACNSEGGSKLVDQLLVEAHFQKSLGLATEEDVIMAATALNCLRRDGWGMVAHERSGCHADDARYARGVLEILPATYFLMYASLQRLSPESTPSFNSQYEEWLRDSGGLKWRQRLTKIRRDGRFVVRDLPQYDEFPEFDVMKSFRQRSKFSPARSKSTSTF